MIKNLIVNGCSFTDDRVVHTWATELKKKYPEIDYHNIASGAAGNDYICNSTIDFLEKHSFNPNNTLVLIMWSGTGRKDLRISGEWWYHLREEGYYSGRNFSDSEYYVFSGGLTNSWTTNKTTKKMFDWLYRLSDPTTLCQNSLLNFLNLENYLKVNQYQYKCTSYVNYWDLLEQSNFNAGDYSIGYFCKDYSLYQNYNFSNWFFVNEQKDCLAEFAHQHGELDTTGHPTEICHKKFAEDVVIPMIKNFITLN